MDFWHGCITNCTYRYTGFCKFPPPRRLCALSKNRRGYRSPLMRCKQILDILHTLTHGTMAHPHACTQVCEHIELKFNAISRKAWLLPPGDQVSRSSFTQHVNCQCNIRRIGIFFFVGSQQRRFELRYNPYMCQSASPQPPHLAPRRVYLLPRSIVGRCT